MFMRFLCARQIQIYDNYLKSKMSSESPIEDQEFERSWRRSEGFELIIEDLVRKGSALRQIRRHNIYFLRRKMCG